MILDDLKILLDDSNNTIIIINQRWNNVPIMAQFGELKKIINDELFWKNENHASLLKEYKKYERLCEIHTRINKNQIQLTELIELNIDDENALLEIKSEIVAHLGLCKKFNLELLMNKKEDTDNCFLEINSGAGGTESQDWADMLLRMYVRFCQDNKLSYDIIDMQNGEEAGIKSATIFIKGDFPTGLLESEIGVHRLVRISPFDANKRRHTSFAAVNLLPEVADIVIDINPSDLRIDTYRAGGAGGQHVNKTDSAVRLTHIPTGLVVQCQNERSQYQNKEVAMKVLKSRLYKREIEMQREKADSIEKKKIEWGSQIRSYVLHPYKMVKDHRTECESPQPERILDGELIDFMYAYLIARD